MIRYFISKSKRRSPVPEYPLTVLVSVSHTESFYYYTDNGKGVRGRLECGYPNEVVKRVSLKDLEGVEFYPPQKGWYSKKTVRNQFGTAGHQSTNKGR